MLQRIANLFGYERRQQVIDSTGPNVDLALPGFYDAVTYGLPNPHQTAAVVFSLGEVWRAFLAATVTPEVPGLSPSILGTMARYTLGTGNSAWMIDLVEGELELYPVAAFEVSGSFRPVSWRYQVELNQPGDSDPVRRNVPAEGMVHLRWEPDPGAPWRGVSPLVRAGMTAGQLGWLEMRMREEVSGNIGYLMPTPDGVSATTANKAAEALRDARGRTQLIETTAGGFGQGAQAAPRGDWEQKRFGPNPPQTMIDMRERSARWIMAALGLPPALFDGNGPGSREAHRALLTRTLNPMGKLLAREVGDKLNIPDLSITFPDIVEGDIVARARAVGGLVQAGMPLAEAMDEAGLT